jgi:exodeoxyribonuclease VII small subunit
MILITDMAKKIDLKELLEAKDGEKIIEDLSFEDGLRILEELVSKLESGGLSLDGAVASYEKGSKLVEKLRALLTGAEEKLKILQIE